MPKTKITPQYFYDQDKFNVLDQEADEYLLGLLARDNEPIVTHNMSYRRWIHPAYESVCYDGVFKYVGRIGGYEIIPWEELPDHNYYKRNYTFFIRGK